MTGRRVLELPRAAMGNAIIILAKRMGTILDSENATERDNDIQELAEFISDIARFAASEADDPTVSMIFPLSRSERLRALGVDCIVKVL